MNSGYDNKIIIACASGNQNNCAISIIRISGNFQLQEFQHHFSKKIQNVKSAQMYRSKLIDGQTIIDDIMFCFYQNPKSYTGENMLELFVHGNKINVNRIIKTFCQNDKVRIAQPGEFTFRAYKNKKITISQAEGLDLFLNATSNFMLSQGLDILQGQLYKKFVELYEKYKEVKSIFEIQIDFCEDVGEEEAQKHFEKALGEFEILIFDLFQRTKLDKSKILTPSIVLSGQTNAGKSTFFNYLLGENRAIVSAIRGTTRDYINEFIEIEGNLYQLVDTAGLRNTAEEIEKEGIQRTKQMIQQAFYKILVINPHEDLKNDLAILNQEEIDFVIITHASSTDTKTKNEILELVKNINYLFIELKSGPIEPARKSGPIEPVRKNGPIEPVRKNGPIEPVSKNGPIEPVSKNGPIEPVNKKQIDRIQLFENNEENKNYLLRCIAEKYKNLAKNEPFLVERQKASIEKSYNKYLKLKEILKQEKDIAIRLSMFSELESEISRLVGYVSHEEVLDNIFKNFCIGK